MIKITGTTAIDCGTVYSVPANAKDIEIQDTQAIRTKTVLHVRDAKTTLESQILELVNDGTPIEDVRKLIDSICELETRSQDAIVDQIYANGFQKCIKAVVGVVGFAANIVTVLSGLNLN